VKHLHTPSPHNSAQRQPKRKKTRKTIRLVASRNSFLSFSTVSRIPDVRDLTL
jgi:hypothetical protein